MKTSHTLIAEWRQLGNYFPLILELVKRDLKVKYRRSVLGYLWSLLNPLMMMLIMHIVFSFMFRFNIENFPLYLICGQTLWNFFTESTNMSMDAVTANGQLIQKVYIPKLILPVTRVFSSMVTMLFSLSAIVLVMVFTGASFSWSMLLFWVPVLFLFIFCCGVGMALSALAVRFRDVKHLYGILTLAWMYLTPIFYTIDMVPQPVAALIRLNPLYQYINFFRQLVLFGSVPSLSTWLICMISSMVSFLVGLLIFREMEDNFILYL